MSSGPKKSEERPWLAVHHPESNARGPAGHWEIVTNKQDGRDTCIVQCLFCKHIALTIVNAHNSSLTDEA